MSLRFGAAIVEAIFRQLYIVLSVFALPFELAVFDRGVCRVLICRQVGGCAMCIKQHHMPGNE